MPDSDPPGTSFQATMPGVPYLWDRSFIPIGVSEDYVVFYIGEHGSSYFIEEVAPGAYVNFDGALGFTVGSSTLTTISTAFDGRADYWGPAVPNPVYCTSTNHRMTLTRR